MGLMKRKNNPYDTLPFHSYVRPLPGVEAKEQRPVGVRIAQGSRQLPVAVDADVFRVFLVAPATYFFGFAGTKADG